MTIETQIKTLPNTPGIYLFYTKNKALIYVGKATSLRNRVRSYFSGGSKTSRPIEELIEEVAIIKYKQTDSALEAIILESIYIKKYQPKYNVLGKDNKSWNYIIITKDLYPEITTIRQHEFALMTEDQKKEAIRYIFGPYPGLNRKETMKLLRKMFRFSYCRPDAARPCLYRQMGQCLGVCTGEISAKDYRRRVIRPLVTFLRGGKKKLVQQWESEMKAAAKAKEFEQAAELRDQLSSLIKIHDIALLNDSFVRDAFDTTDDRSIVRIEGYDISNFGKTGVVGSMVVFMHGEPEKSQYRKFEIKTVDGQNDVGALREVMTRRIKRLNSADTAFAAMDPDIFLIDGGKPQLNAVQSVLTGMGVTIPVVSIAKGKERKRNDFFFGTETPKEVIHWVDRHKDILIRVRDEAHRFALQYQKQKRKLKR